MKWGKVALVIFGAIIITALGIDAADTLQGNKGTLLSQVMNADNNGCPSGMLPVENVPGVQCVDMFEASPSAECIHAATSNNLETQKNLEDTTCHAVSEEGGDPWNHITLGQAQLACAQAGKRLLTSSEWYRIALGTKEIDCKVDTNVAQVTSPSECMSALGVYDMVGNVWEWVDETVREGHLEGTKLPSTGYVQATDTHGIAIATASTSDTLHGEDYFWSKNEGVFGMIRGGFYNSGTDAGVYSANASVPTNLNSDGIGFRCAQGS